MKRRLHLSHGARRPYILFLLAMALHFALAHGALGNTFVDSNQNLGTGNGHAVALGDIDSDGDLDAFVANFGEPNKVWLNAAGTFSDSLQNLGNANSRAVVLGDLDADGDLDAAVGNESQPNTVWFNTAGVFTNSGQGLGQGATGDLRLADLDNDGDLDLFVANVSGQGNRVLLNDGSGTFTDTGQSLGNSNSSSASLADLDGDGDFDAYVGNFGQGNRVWFNNGSAIFTDSNQSLGTSFTQAVALGDLDGDNDVDAVTANNYGEPNRVWLNTGNTGTFVDSGLLLGSSRSRGIVLEDVDWDGDLDAFVSNRFVQANRLYLNANNTGLLADSGCGFGSSSSFAAAIGDLDGDNASDVFVTNAMQPNKIWLNASGPHCLRPPINMSAWWPFDESSGSTATEIVSGNDGAYVGGPTPVAGVVAGALHFDGNDDYVEAQDDADLDVGTGDFSVDTWVRITGGSGIRILADKRREQASVQGYSLYIFGSGELGFQMADGIGSNICSTSSTSSCTNFNSGTSIADNEWHFVAVTVDRDDTSGGRFYIDGVLVGTFDPTVRSGSLDNNFPLRLGRRTSGPSFFLAGDLDEFEIFKRELRPDEVRSLFRAGTAGKCKDGLDVPWDEPFCMGHASRVVDIEVCNYSATAQNYELTLSQLPSGSSGSGGRCSIDGPDTFETLDSPPMPIPPPVAVSIPPQTCRSVPVRIFRPSQMTATDLVGCYEAALTNLSTSSVIRVAGSVQDKRDECAVREDPTKILLVGEARNLSFRVTNTSGEAATLTYSIEVHSPDPRPLRNVLSLNGQEPGVPVVGVLSLDPGEDSQILTEVEYLESDPFGFQHLVVFTQEGDSQIPLLSQSLRTPLPGECSGIFCDGFESGDTSAWSVVVQ